MGHCRPVVCHTVVRDAVSTRPRSLASGGREVHRGRPAERRRRTASPPPGSQSVAPPEAARQARRIAAPAQPRSCAATHGEDHSHGQPRSGLIGKGRPLASIAQCSPQAFTTDFFNKVCHPPAPAVSTGMGGAFEPGLGGPLPKSTEHRAAKRPMFEGRRVLQRGAGRASSTTQPYRCRTQPHVGSGDYPPPGALGPRGRLSCKNAFCGRPFFQSMR